MRRWTGNVEPVEEQNSMTPTILLWWWIFLAAALLVTLIDVYLLMRVVSLARQIAVLSHKSAPAALGIVGNTAVGADLTRLVQLLAALAKNADDLRALTGALAARLMPRGR
jgi:hypothetical protein